MLRPHIGELPPKKFARKKNWVTGEYGINGREPYMEIEPEKSEKGSHAENPLC
jgi:hypothetical protein